MMVEWEFLHPRANIDHLGWIPYWINDEDPDPLWKQIDKNYQHGGGWHSSKHLWEGHVKGTTLTYPGDPPQRPIAKVRVRNETLYFYPHAWVMIVQEDGTWDVARID